MQKKEAQSLPVYSIVEIVFDAAYLVFAVVSGIVMLAYAQPGSDALRLYGALALVLGGGDAFHLIPRIRGQLRRSMESKALGVGKLVTSLTMTVFYLLLFAVWTVVYAPPFAGPFGVVLLILAAARIILSLCPQNRWLHPDAPLRWAVYRNIPFFAMGVIVLCLFASTSLVPADPFRFMPLAVGLSFLFYVPVVLFSKKNPKLGALMLPKTLAYVWILAMGFHLIP